MISRIKGSLISKNIPIIEILCSGLTYEILVSMETFNKLPELSSDVDIFVAHEKGRWRKLSPKVAIQSKVG